MKKILIICLMMIFILGMTSCSADKKESEWKQDTLGEMTFDVEQGWEKEEQTDKIHTFYYFDDEEQSVLDVMVQPITDGVNSKAVLEEVVKSIARDGNTLNFTTEDWEANGVQGIKYTYDLENESRKAQAVTTIYDGVAYTFNFLLTEAAAETYVEVVDHVFSSVKLADGGENPYVNDGSTTGTREGTKADNGQMFYSIPYKDLIDDPDAHNGSMVNYEGTLLNVVFKDELAEGYLAIDGNQDQILYLTYMKGLTSPEPAEGDHIKITGMSMGIFKNQPWISVSQISR